MNLQYCIIKSLKPKNTNGFYQLTKKHLKTIISKNVHVIKQNSFLLSVPGTVIKY